MMLSPANAGVAAQLMRPIAAVSGTAWAQWAAAAAMTHLAVAVHDNAGIANAIAFELIPRWCCRASLCWFDAFTLSATQPGMHGMCASGRDGNTKTSGRVTGSWLASR